MRPPNGSAVKTPCPGGVSPWTVTPAAMQASGTRLLALQRAIGVGYANDVPRAGAHCCTNARSPSSPFPHRYFRVLSMLFGQPACPAIIAALMSQRGDAAAKMTRLIGRFASLLERRCSSESLIKSTGGLPNSFMHWQFQIRR